MTQVSGGLSGGDSFYLFVPEMNQPKPCGPQPQWERREVDPLEENVGFSD